MLHYCPITQEVVDSVNTFVHFMHRA